jgi:hypothetical protein
MALVHHCRRPSEEEEGRYVTVDLDPLGEQLAQGRRSRESSQEGRKSDWVRLPPCGYGLTCRVNCARWQNERVGLCFAVTLAEPMFGLVEMKWHAFGVL